MWKMWLLTCLKMLVGNAKKHIDIFKVKYNLWCSVFNYQELSVQPENYTTKTVN